MEDDSLLRYSRQIMLPEFGYEAQEKLQQTQVLILGLGGLGSPAALYLASSGVAHITLVDDDAVDLSNLQRQIVHRTKDIGLNKAVSAKQTLTDLNPSITVQSVTQRLKGDALITCCQKADVVLDCTDRFESRFAINQACFDAKTNLVSAAAIGFSGQLSSYDFSKQHSPCYQCLYPDRSEEELLCSENGILAPIVGTMGLLQALETLKIITGVGQNLNGKMLMFDGLNMEFRTVNMTQDENCPICAASKSD